LTQMKTYARENCEAGNHYLLPKGTPQSTLSHESILRVGNQIIDGRGAFSSNVDFSREIFKNQIHLSR
jgi:hypothetical protein